MFAYVRFSAPPHNKKIVPVSEIKRFDPVMKNSKKQYKVKNGDVYSDALVLSVEETRAKLEDKIQKKRIVIPPTKHLVSASESSMDESVTRRTNVDVRHKQKIQDNLDIRLQRIKERSGYKSPLQDIQNAPDVVKVAGMEKSPKKPHAQYGRTYGTGHGKKTEYRQVDTNTTPVLLEQRRQPEAVQDAESTALQKERHQACNQKIASLQQKCSSLELLIRSLQDQIQQKREEHSKQNKEWCQKQESFRKKEESILKHMTDKETELQNLRRLNRELQESAINHFDQINATIREMKSTGKISFTDCEPPVGYIRKDDKMIHLGRGQWMATETYAMAASNARTPSMFVRNMTVAVFGFNHLLRGTVSGVGSNRNQRTQAPENKLNPVQIMALKDIFRYWMLKEQKMSEIDADIEVEKTRKYIGRKIADLKSQSQSIDRSRNKSTADDEYLDGVEDQNIDAETVYSNTQDDALEQSGEDASSLEEIEQEVDGSEEIEEQVDNTSGSEQDMSNQSQEDIFADTQNQEELPDLELSQADGENETAEFSQQHFDSMKVLIGTQL